MAKIIYYYQTLIDLLPLINAYDSEKSNFYETLVMILSSIHFGYNPDGTPYIHLNDYPPTDTKFNKCWEQLNILSNKGTTIMLMMGGAGGAYRELFSNFEVYYPMLKNTIKTHSIIKGIDLDIEEYIQYIIKKNKNKPEQEQKKNLEQMIDEIKMLINKLIIDFTEDFIVTMAPLGGSLESDTSGMGGFVYKTLYTSVEGKYIDWFNCQCYGAYSLNIVDNIVKNDYPPEKIVMGMLSGQYPNQESFNTALITVQNIKNKYPTFGGVYVWEYIDSPPNNGNASTWATDIYKVLNGEYDSNNHNSKAFCNIS